MNKKELIERVAAGLRNMELKPDGLVYMIHEIKESDHFWDEETICALPVIYCELSSNINQSALSVNCPFLPYYKQFTDKNYMQSVYFTRGFDDINI